MQAKKCRCWQLPSHCERLRAAYRAGSAGGFRKEKNFMLESKWKEESGIKVSRLKKLFKTGWTEKHARQAGAPCTYREEKPVGQNCMGKGKN